MRLLCHNISSFCCNKGRNLCGIDDKECDSSQACWIFFLFLERILRISSVKVNRFLYLLKIKSERLSIRKRNSSSFAD